MARGNFLLKITSLGRVTGIADKIRVEGENERALRLFAGVYN